MQGAFAVTIAWRPISALVIVLELGRGSRRDIRRNERFEGSDEWRDLILDEGPHLGHINARIVMYEPVSKAGNAIPRDFRVGLPQIHRDLAGRLAHYLQNVQGCELPHLVGQKRLGRASGIHALRASGVD